MLAVHPLSQIMYRSYFLPRCSCWLVCSDAWTRLSSCGSSYIWLLWWVRHFPTEVIGENQHYLIAQFQKILACLFSYSHIYFWTSEKQLDYFSLSQEWSVDQGGRSILHTIQQFGRENACDSLTAKWNQRVRVERDSLHWEHLHQCVRVPVGRLLCSYSRTAPPPLMVCNLGTVT